MDTANAAPAQEIDFGQGRLLEAQLAMRAIFGRLEKERFTGQRLGAGEVAPEFEDAGAAATYYQKALVEFLKGLGVEITVLPPAPENADDIVLHQFDEVSGQNTAQFMAPFETLVISGSVPGNAMNGGRKATGQIIEACAEVARVLLGNAVVAAFEDAKEDESVVAYFRAQPEFGGRVDFETLKMTGLARVRAMIYCKTEPRVSYLLGSCWGQAKPRKIVWDFPLVEHIYGQDRLRWRDLRSPDYEPAPAPKGVVPS